MAGGSSDGLAASLHYAEYVKIVADHPIVTTFISGENSMPIQYLFLLSFSKS